MMEFLRNLITGALDFVSGAIAIICVLLGLWLSCRGIRTPMFSNGWWDEVKGRLIIGLFGGFIVGAIITYPVNAVRDFFKVEKKEIVAERQYQEKKNNKQKEKKKEKQEEEDDESTMDKLDKLQDSINQNMQSNDNSIKDNSVNTQNPVNNSNSTSKYRQNMNDVSIGDVSISCSVEEMHRNIGKEKTIKRENNSKKTTYQYDDLDVVVIDGKVVGFVSNTSRLATPRGIKQGDMLQDVLRKYGDPYAKSDYDGTTLYEYKFSSQDNRDCLIRFAIKDGRVDYISGRIME